MIILLFKQCVTNYGSSIHLYQDAQLQLRIHNYLHLEHPQFFQYMDEWTKTSHKYGVYV